MEKKIVVFGLGTLLTVGMQTYEMMSVSVNPQGTTIVNINQAMVLPQDGAYGYDGGWRNLHETTLQVASTSSVYTFYWGNGR